MRKLFVVAALALCIESLGFAASAAIISGTIKDADGSLFRAAFVRVQNVKTKMTMMVLIRGWNFGPLQEPSRSDAK